jgi:hypothetical protein
MKTQFKTGAIVKVDECYLTDEVTKNVNTSETATVLTIPDDNEELVGIVYQSGELDFVPQNILEIIEE